MSETVLEEVISKIEAAPHSGASLLLFALTKTLDMPKGGHMYMLKKLQEMDAETRQLAYGLMELMAEGKNQGDTWQQAVARIESLIRGG